MTRIALVGVGIAALCSVALLAQTPPGQTPPAQPAPTQTPQPTPTRPPVTIITPAQTIQPPLFKSSVELVAVDVQVVDREGRPILRLPAEQFDVSIDGRRRQVVSVDMVRYTQSLAGAAPRIYTGAVTGSAESITGRMFILAFDQLSFRVGQARVAADASRHLIDLLQPDDVIGLYPFPDSTHVNLTHERASVRGALGKIVGLQEPLSSQFNLSISEIIDITAGDDYVLDRVVQRECPRNDTTCKRLVHGEAFALGATAEAQAAQSLAGLHAILGSLRYLSGRKTMIVVSGGMLASDRGGGRPDIRTQTVELGREAAAANTNLYVLHMDTSFVDAFATDRRKLNLNTLFRDNALQGEGLELLAGAAGGALFRVDAGTPDRAFERVMRETSAYYLLGIEVADADRDGKPHFINVNVKQSGATVRNRPMVVIPRTRTVAPSGRPPQSFRVPVSSCSACAYSVITGSPDSASAFNTHSCSDVESLCRSIRIRTQNAHSRSPSRCRPSARRYLMYSPSARSRSGPSGKRIIRLSSSMHRS